MIRSLSWYSTQNHTKELLPAIEDMLKTTGQSHASLQGIAVASGPGGFSALRVGLSVAKGLAMPVGLPVVSVGTLECEAYPYAATNLPICPLLDVGRNEVATAMFQQTDRWTRLSQERICAPDELATLPDDVPGPFVICGEGVAGRQERLRELFGQRAFILSAGHQSRLSALAELGPTKT